MHTEDLQIVVPQIRGMHIAVPHIIRDPQNAVPHIRGLQIRGRLMYNRGKKI
jgi:hypothetical protein